VIDTFLVVIPLMLSPGPANLVCFVLGTRNNLYRLFPFQLGIIVVYGVVALAVGLLSTQINTIAPSVNSMLQVLGGLFIIYLGIQLARQTDNEMTAKAPTFLSGVMLQSLNPKYPAVVLAVFANRHGQPTLMTTSAILIVGAIGLIAYASAGALLCTRGVSGRGFRVLDIASGALLCAVGLWFTVQPLMARW
jgi:threonine/homoserine/homoserine lactone efflux protein